MTRPIGNMHQFRCDSCGRTFHEFEFVETIEEFLCERCASGIDPDKHVHYGYSQGDDEVDSLRGQLAKSIEREEQIERELTELHGQLADAKKRESLKCPNCNEGTSGADYYGEAMDCHYCDGHGRITAAACIDLQDRFQGLVGDHGALVIELDELRHANAELVEELKRLQALTDNDDDFHSIGEVIAKHSPARGGDAT